MTIPDFHTFALSKFKGTTARKKKAENALAKQWSWTAQIKDNDGNLIDNPVSFQEEFNKNRVWRYLREEMVAGQKKIDAETATPIDTFNDLVS
jgi:hypothetical protein